MLAAERRNEIERLINLIKSVLVTELADQFEVTPETIRGDLLKLEKQGVLVRSYGGATLAGGAGQELGYKERDTVNTEAKRRIGGRAAEMIRSGDTIFLDASTSALHLARQLRDKNGLTVITNAVSIITELADCENIKLISTGGRLSGGNMSYVGRFAERMIRAELAANRFFFSCRGVTFARGLMDSSEDEAEIKRAMLECSDSAVFLCDHNKLGKVGVPVIAPIESIDTFITDIRLDDEWREELEKRDIEIITA